MFDAKEAMSKVQNVFDIRMPVEDIYKFHFVNQQMIKESKAEIFRGNPDPIKESPYFGMASEAVDRILFYVAELTDEADEAVTAENLLLKLGSEYRMFFRNSGIWGESQHKAYLEVAESALKDYLDYKSEL